MRTPQHNTMWRLSAALLAMALQAVCAWAEDVPPVIPVASSGPTPVEEARPAPEPARAAPAVPAHEDLDADSRTRPIEFGDVLDVTVPRYTEFSRLYPVAKDGTITVDLLGSLPVQGLTAPALEQLLIARFTPFLRHPEGVVVRITARRMTVRVLGQVEDPGAKVLPRGAGVQEAIAAARGVSTGALLDRVVVRRTRRGWVEELPCDLKAFLEGRGALPELANGDEVFVPRMAFAGHISRPITPDDVAATLPRATVLVLGAVKNPSELVLREAISLPAALAQCGGALDTADLAHVRRIPAGNGVAEPVDVAAWLAQGGRMPLLQPGDVVVVPSKEVLGPTVRVAGAVAKPGMVQLPARSDVQAALAAAGGPLPAADLHRLQLHRRQGGEVVRSTLDLDAILRAGNPEALVPLQEGDTLFVPRATGVGENGAATVYVFGSVEHPGAYPLAESRSVLQALALAGGLLATADRERLTITRAPGTAGPRTVRFDLAAYQAGRSDALPQLAEGDTVDVAPFEVNVVGEVVRGGTLPLRPGSNLVEAIAAAGGPSANADLGRVGLTRKEADGAKHETFNLRVYLHNPEQAAAVPLVHSGDTVSLEAMPPDARAVVVLGAVQRPGTVSVGEGGASLVSALAQAGGLTPTGDRAAVRVVRADTGKCELLDLRAVLEGGAAAPRVQAGDVVSVDELGRPGSGVLVLGAVVKQGWVTLNGGKLTVMQALAQAGGLQPGAAAGNARLVRAGGQPEVLDLTRFANGQPSPLVSEGDTIIIGYHGQARSIWDQLLNILPVVSFFTR